MVDLTADSSSEGSSGSNHLQVVRVSAPVEKRLKFQDDSQRLRLLIRPILLSSSTRIVQHFCHLLPLLPRLLVLAQQTLGPSFYLRMVCPECFVQTSQNALSEPHSPYPSLSLPAQPVVDNSEAFRTSLRSKKPTKFVSDPLSHSVKLVDEAQDLPSGSALSFSLSPRIPLIRVRSHMDIMEMSASPFAKTNKTLKNN